MYEAADDGSYEAMAQAYQEDADQEYVDPYQAEHDAQMAKFVTSSSGGYDDSDFVDVAASSPLSDYADYYMDEVLAAGDSLEDASSDAWYESLASEEEAQSASESAAGEELTSEDVSSELEPYGYEESIDGTESYDTESYDTESYDTESYDTESYDTESYDTDQAQTDTQSQSGSTTEASTSVQSSTDSEASVPSETQTQTSTDTNLNSTSSNNPESETEEAPVAQTGSTTEEKPVDPRFAWEPLSFRASEGSLANALTLEPQLDDLHSVLPSGTATFTTVTTVSAAPIVEPSDPELGEGEKTTNSSEVVTLSQTFNSPTDWGVTESVTRTFSTAENSTDPDGANQDFGRSGEETFTVTVINGTTTIRSYSITDTFSYESGDIDGVAPGSSPASWAVPTGWEDKATTPPEVEEEAESETSEEESIEDEPGDAEPVVLSEFVPGDDMTDDDESETTSSSESFGARYTATVTFTISVTETLITLPDGRSGRTITVGTGSSKSFLSLASGGYSSSSSEGKLANVTIKAKPETEATDETAESDESASDETTDSADSTAPLLASVSDTDAESENDDAATPTGSSSLEVTTAPGGNGHSVNASASFLSYAGSSTSFSGTTSITVADGDDPAEADPAGYASFSTNSKSGQAGSSSLNGTWQTSTGNDYDYLNINATSSGGSSNHFNFSDSVTIGTPSSPLPPLPPEVLNVGRGNHGKSNGTISYVSNRPYDASGSYGESAIYHSTATSSGATDFNIGPNDDGDFEIGFEISGNSESRTNGVFATWGQMYGNQDTSWLPDGATWFQHTWKQSTNFGQTTSTDVTYGVTINASGLTVNDKSSFEDEVSVSSLDHSKEHSILLDGSVQIRETHFRDGVHYTISKPEVGDVSGSVTTTSSTTYTGYENAPPNTSTSNTTTLALADLTSGMGGDAQPARSSESILEEYRDRSEQVAPANETNPDLRDYYQ